MTQEPTSNKTKVCPTCGTRLSENAVRCLVCGTEFTAQPESKAAKKSEKSVQASRMPEVRLSLPAAIGVLAIIIVIVAVTSFFVARAGAPVGTFDPVETPTPTETPTATIPPTNTLPPTDIPTCHTSTAVRIYGLGK
jgi:ribosomal protein L40E